MTMHWPTLPRDEKIKALSQLADQGLTASQIAASFAAGPSRNAIIGLAARAGVKLQSVHAKIAQENKARGPKAPRVPGKAREYKKSMNWTRVRSKTSLPPTPMPEPEPELDTSYVRTFAEALASGCKWPLWDRFEGEHVSMCCGAPRAETGPYCQHHARRSIGRGTESEKSADRLLRKYA